MTKESNDMNDDRLMDLFRVKDGARTGVSDATRARHEGRVMVHLVPAETVERLGMIVVEKDTSGYAVSVINPFLEDEYGEKPFRPGSYDYVCLSGLADAIAALETTQDIDGPMVEMRDMMMQVEHDGDIGAFGRIAATLSVSRRTGQSPEGVLRYLSRELEPA